MNLEASQVKRKERVRRVNNYRNGTEEKQRDQCKESPSDLATLQYTSVKQNGRDEAPDRDRDQSIKGSIACLFKCLNSALHLMGNHKGVLNRRVLHAHLLI